MSYSNFFLPPSQSIEPEIIHRIEVAENHSVPVSLVPPEESLSNIHFHSRDIVMDSSSQDFTSLSAVRQGRSPFVMPIRLSSPGFILKFSTKVEVPTTITMFEIDTIPFPHTVSVLEGFLPVFSIDFITEVAYNVIVSYCKNGTKKQMEIPTTPFDGGFNIVFTLPCNCGNSVTVTLY